MVRTGKIAFHSHCVLATSFDFSPRPFHASAMTMVRSCHILEDGITLLTCSFGSLHICCIFATGSYGVYVTFSELSINTGSNSSHHHLCFNNDMNINQEFSTGTNTGTCSWWWTTWPSTHPLAFTFSSTASLWILRGHSFTYYVDTRKLAEWMRTRRCNIYKIRKDTMRT